MKRFYAVLIVFAVLMCLPIGAKAFVSNVSLSVGEGAIWTHGNAHRLPVSVELIPSMSVLMILKVDLGMYLTTEKPADFMVRPGIRVCTPFLYGRLAFPLKLTHGFDYGFLVGVGRDLVNLSIISLFIEVDTFFMHDTGFKAIPVEGRLGVSVGF